MSFEDKTLACEDCGSDFIHSAEDQAKYSERGFQNEPKRCRPCREKRRAQSGRGASADGGGGGYGGGGGGGGYGGGGSRPERESFEAVCAECGATTTVPFQPTQGRPVYCRDCFRARR